MAAYSAGQVPHTYFCPIPKKNNFMPAVILGQKLGHKLKVSLCQNTKLNNSS